MDHSARIATDLAETARALTDAILSRVWILGHGDLCSTCAMAPECPDRRQCLHLAASVGVTRRLDGPWRRVPLGAGEVGNVARTLQPRVLAQGELAVAGVAEPGWLALHRTRAFGVWPLHENRRCRGVLAFFAPHEPAATACEALDALGRVGGAALAGAPAALETRGAHGAESTESPHAIPAVSMADVQRRAILATLARTHGRVSGPGGAAEILGMKPTTLESRIRRLGVRKPPRLQL